MTIEIRKSLLGRDTSSQVDVHVSEKPAASITGKCISLKQQVPLKRLFTFTRLQGTTNENRLSSQPLPCQPPFSLGIETVEDGFKWQDFKLLNGTATE